MKVPISVCILYTSLYPVFRLRPFRLMVGVGPHPLVNQRALFHFFTLSAFSPWTSRFRRDILIHQINALNESHPDSIDWHGS